MVRSHPGQIIAHVKLLREVDRLLQADTVREKRDAPDRMLAAPAPDCVRQTSDKTGRRADD